MKPNDKLPAKQGTGYAPIGVPIKPRPLFPTTDDGRRVLCALARLFGVHYSDIERTTPSGLLDLSTAQSLELERRAFIRGWC